MAASEFLFSMVMLLLFVLIIMAILIIHTKFMVWSIRRILMDDMEELVDKKLEQK